MKTQACLSRAALADLLVRGDSGTNEFDRHLEECSHCQRALEEVAADAPSWREAREALCDAAQAPTRELGDAISTLKIRGSDGGHQHPNRSSSSDEYAFLDAPAAVGELGSLKHYRVLELIGRGGFGMVFKALDETLKRHVAIKVLTPNRAGGPEARKRFQREAQAVAKVVHENVVTIHAVGEVRGHPYLVMQHIEGVSLQRRIRENGPLGLEVIVRIAIQAADGLAAAHHQGLVHRDVKPDNILLQRGDGRVKLTDFGMARDVDDTSLTQFGSIAGTPEFMAPEQANGRNRVDHRADLFSLGSVIHAMATGRFPFGGSSVDEVLHEVLEGNAKSIRESRPELPEWLDELVARLHAKNPADRPRTADEVADYLRERLAELRQPHPEAPLIEVPASIRPTSRRPKQAWGPAALVVAATLGMGVTAIAAIAVMQFMGPSSPPKESKPAAAPADKKKDNRQTAPLEETIDYPGRSVEERPEPKYGPEKDDPFDPKEPKEPKDPKDFKKGPKKDRPPPPPEGFDKGRHPPPPPGGFELLPGPERMRFEDCPDPKDRPRRKP
jgi:serine/threonine protein kinase